MKHGRSTAPRGFTLIETLVVVCVISILASLLAPAVQRTREAAARARCLNNLRQIGLGLNAYLAMFNAFPPACGSSEIRGRLLFRKEFSSFTNLLPQLDLQPLFSSMNFEVEAYDPYAFGFHDDSSRSNRTVFDTKVALFLCPSDGSAGATDAPGVSYRVNLGAKFTMHEFGTAAMDGPLSGYLARSPSMTIDGLSHTVAFSEKLAGCPNAAGLDPRVAMFVVPPPDPKDTAVYNAVYAQACRGLESYYGYSSAGGLTWMIGAMSQTGYNHLFGINGRYPDCIVAITGVTPTYGILGARSNHPGGVNTLMADGSARFASETTNLEVWRALGTRAGGELISDSW